MSAPTRLSWLLTADDRASSVFKGVAGSMATLDDRANAVRNTLNALASAAAVGYFAHQIKSTVDLADKLDELSQFTGMSVSALSTLKYAAETTGPGMDVLTAATQTLFKAMGNAVGGNKELEAAFKAVGLSIDDLKRLSTDEVLMRIADGMAGLPDGAQKAELALKLFKGSAEEMVPWLNQGSAAIAQLRQEAIDAGVAISDDFAAKAAELNDNLAKLEAQTKVLSIEIGQSLVPVINSVASSMLGARQAGEGWLQSIVDGVFSAHLGQATQLETKLARIQGILKDAKSDMSDARLYLTNPIPLGMGRQEYIKQQEAVAAATEKQLKDLYAQMAKPNGSKANPPKPGKEGKGDGPGFYEPPKPPKAAAAVKRDPFILDRAESDAALRREQATYEARTALLQGYLRTGEISYADYYAGLSAVEDDYYAAGRAKLEAELARQAKIAKTGTVTERDSALAKEIDLRSELDSLESKHAAGATTRAADQKAAQEALTRSLEQHYVQFLEMSGREVEAAELKAAAQFAEIERLAKINGLSTEHIDRIKEMTVAVARYDAIQREMGNAQSARELAELKATNATASGAQSQYTLEKRLVQIRKESARAMLAQAEAALKLAQATGDQARVLEAEKAIAQIQNTMDQLDGMQALFWDSLEGHTQSALEGILNGTTSIMDGVKGIMTGVVQDINREVSRELSAMVREWLFQTAKMQMPSMTGGGSSGGGWIDTAVSFVGSLFGARAAGGSASGLTLVGENGPELAYMGQGGHVYNNARTQQMLRQGPAAGQAPQVVMHVHAKDAASFKRSEGQIAGMLSNAVRRGSRNS